MSGESNTPSVRYRTIVADPPWEIGDFPPNFGYANGKSVPYPTMTVDEIKALPVARFADSGAHLYLWTINDYIPEAYAVAEMWGFVPSVLLTWCKPPLGTGLGGRFISDTEFILYAISRFPRKTERRREIAAGLRDAWLASGKNRAEIDDHFGTKNVAGHWFTPDGFAVNAPTPDQWPWVREWLGVNAGSELDRLVLEEHQTETPPLARATGRWFIWPRGKHSAKPEAFMDMVEQVSPGPYLELFARRNRLGWDTWGNESLELVEIVA